MPAESTPIIRECPFAGLSFHNILFILLPECCCAQDFGLDKLANSRWTSALFVTDFTIGGLKKIGLSKLKIPVDSLRNNMSIWEFTEKELKIVNHKYGEGLDSLMVKCTYDYDKNTRVLRLFHFSQDSNFWEYSLAISSSGNYLLMTREN